MAHICSVRLVDDYGRTTNKRYELTTAVVADAITESQAAILLLDAVTDMGLVKATLLVDLGATPTSPATGANKDAGMTITGLLEGGLGKKASTKVPAPIAACINPDGTIDLTQTAVAAFLVLWSADPPDFKISDGEEIESWTKGTLDG